MESLDRFYDNSGAFREFLDKQRYKNKAKSHDIRLRSENRIHTKVMITVLCSLPDLTFQYGFQRMGIPLNKQYLKVPEMSRAEYYDICEFWSTVFLWSHMSNPVCKDCLGSAQHPLRFLEFETI